MPQPRVAQNLVKATPLLKPLLECFGGQLRKPSRSGAAADRPLLRKTPEPPRVDIVDEKLCGMSENETQTTWLIRWPDEALEHLAPSLEKYKGCTVLDVHPGACLWSRKLHEFLRPKCHILMEPERRYLDTFIRPLLDEKDSTYRHTLLTGAHPQEYFGNYTKILSDGKLMQPRLPLRADEPARLNIDTTFLVTGNLARRYSHARPRAAVSSVSIILQHMTWFALANEIFHAGGRVRMLWWAPEAPIKIATSGASTDQSGYQIGLRMGADIESIVAEGLAQAPLEIARPVGERRVTAANPELSPGLDISVPATDMPVKEHLKVPTSPLALGYATADDLSNVLEQLESRWSFFAPLAKSHFLTKTRDLQLSSLLKTLAYPQFQEELWQTRLSSNGAFRRLGRLKASVAFDLTLQLINLEAHFCHFAERGDGVHHLRPRLLQLDESIAGLRGNGPRIDQDQSGRGQSAYVAANSLAEEIHARCVERHKHSDKSMQRKPLQAKPTSFWPQTALALLDVKPTSRDLSVPGIVDAKQCAKTCQILLKYLFAYRRKPLSTVLDRIAPNAGRDVIPLAPAVSDARKGGRLNSARVRPGMLNEDMVEQLVKAWFEWPFHPDSAELQMTAGDLPTSEEADRDVLVPFEQV